MTPFFSIIVPVYNVESFLEKCLDSVLSQTFTSWEMICVNDGSTDGSGRILSGYAETHDNIKVSTIENSGTAAARNEGLSSARGEYILFIDSDDWITPDALQVIHDALQGNEVDLLSFNGFIYNETDGKTEADTGKLILPTTGWKYYNEHILRKRKFHFVCVVTRAFKRSYLEKNKLFFRNGILHEDNLFTPLAFYHANMVAEIPSPLYYYRIREGSKMQEFTIKQVIDKLTVNNLLGEFFLSKTIIRLDMISRIIASDYISLHGERVRKAIGKEQDKVLSMINQKLFRQSCKTPRHRFLYLLIRIHPSLYRAYIKLARSIH